MWYVYIKKFLWYTDAKVSEESQEELVRILVKHLPKEENGAEDIMRTIAQKYIEEGFEEGILQGIEQGEARGEARGVQRIAINMLNKQFDIESISNATGFSISEVIALKAKLPMMN